MSRPEYCPVENETPDPCPACGATVEGHDKVRGVCQARNGRQPAPLVEIILVRRSLTPESGNKRAEP